MRRSGTQSSIGGCALLSLVLAAIGGSGCGGSGAAPARAEAGTGIGAGTVVGTVDGLTLVPLATFSAVGGIGGNNSGTLLELLLATRADACKPPGPPLGANQQIVFYVYVATGPNMFAAPTAPGTFAVFPSFVNPPAMGAFVSYQRSDATCGEVNHVAASGVVTLTKVAAGDVQGTFDLMIANGSHLTGTFDAPTCAPLQNPPTEAPILDAGTCR